jgi:hypothetical protein
LIPELQGRFPIRVELKPLTIEDFKRILTEPKNSLVRQYTALLGTEGIDIRFSEDAIDSIARFAFSVNEQTEDIGQGGCTPSWRPCWTSIRSKAGPRRQKRQHRFGLCPQAACRDS